MKQTNFYKKNKWNHELNDDCKENEWHFSHYLYTTTILLQRYFADEWLHIVVNRRREHFTFD